MRLSNHGRKATYPCWVCGKPFQALRCTAMMCSDACRMARSRFHKKHGRWPKNGEMIPTRLIDPFRKRQE